MLPLFHEYRVAHPRFKEHLRVALCMAMVAPACAFIFFQTLGWWNPWLLGTCGVGLSIALCLYSVVMIHRHPLGLSRRGHRLVARTDNWFPYFFVIMQSLIVSLIILFVWFSISELALAVPLYVHVMILLLALLIPARRFIWANVSRTSPLVYDRWDEALRALWHVLMTLFLTRTIIALTIADTGDVAPENIAWQAMLWVPAILYIVFTMVITIDHLYHLKEKRRRSSTPKVLNTADTESAERF